MNISIISGDFIEDLFSLVQNEIGVYIEIDTGYHRSGVNCNNLDEIKNILDKISKFNNCIFKGFLTHDGHTYLAKSLDDIRSIHKCTIDKLTFLKNYFKYRFENIELSIGDTPSCSIIPDFNGINEIRPGNYIFYDLMQQQLGVCKYSQIAIAVACPIVAKYSERNEIVIYGGAVHLSKEFIIENNNKVFGKVVRIENDCWSEPIDGCYISSLSQEHGIIKCRIEKLSEFHVGEIIGILPVHACLTANLMKSYHSFDGEYYDHLESIENKIL